MDTDNIVFDLIIKLVWSAGGDGDGIVVVPDSRAQEISEKFEKWIYCHQICYNRHELSKYHILFLNDSNENISFVGESETDKAKLSWKPDVWLEIR